MLPTTANGRLHLCECKGCPQFPEHLHVSLCPKGCSRFPVDTLPSCIGHCFSDSRGDAGDSKGGLSLCTAAPPSPAGLVCTTSHMLSPTACSADDLSEASQVKPKTTSPNHGSESTLSQGSRRRSVRPLLGNSDAKGSGALPRRHAMSPSCWPTPHAAASMKRGKEAISKETTAADQTSMANPYDVMS